MSPLFDLVGVALHLSVLLLMLPPLWCWCCWWPHQLLLRTLTSSGVGTNIAAAAVAASGH